MCWKCTLLLLDLTFFGHMQPNSILTLLDIFSGHFWIAPFCTAMCLTLVRMKTVHMLSTWLRNCLVLVHNDVHTSKCVGRHSSGHFPRFPLHGPSFKCSRFLIRSVMRLDTFWLQALSATPFRHWDTFRLPLAVRRRASHWCVLRKQCTCYLLG